MPNSADIFRKNVVNLARQIPLSMRALAIKIGMDPSGFSKIINGKNDPSLETLDKVASALGVDPSVLLAKTSPALSGLFQSPIEARLAALESKVFSKSSSPEQSDERMARLEKLRDEIALEAYGSQGKKSDHKTGTE